MWRPAGRDAPAFRARLCGGNGTARPGPAAVREFLTELAQTLVASPTRTMAVTFLSEVRGAPPLVQTVHLLGLAAIMGSAVLINLRMLGLIVPSQGAGELTRRLMPWTWWALPFMAASGVVFVLARPPRYLLNPVFGLKFAMLVPALILAAALHRASLKDEHFWERSPGRRAAGRAVAAASLILWLGVAMAGRWIAYADYLFPPP